MARPEVTGRKSSAGKEPHPRSQRPAWRCRFPSSATHTEFQRGHVLQNEETKRGLTPREMKIGTRTLITFEAAAKWRAEREAASTAPPEKARAKREQAV